jgi:MFS transporter, UMF1 family
MKPDKEGRKERVGWYFYDWANSAFYTVVITVFLGPYLTYITLNAADLQKNIYLLGIPIYAESFYAYSISFSVLMQFIFLPYIGALADYNRNKKLLLGLFAFIGSFSTMGLFFLEGSNYLLGGGLLLIANLSFGASVVVYNSFLNDISEPANRDTVSSIGWATGYIGGGIILFFNLILYSQAKLFGITTDFAVRICLSSAGFWWAVFTIIPLLTLKNRKSAKSLQVEGNMLTSGFRQLIKTITDSFRYPQTMLFLLAYLFYNDGIQATITMSSQFGNQEFGLGMSTLTLIILIFQFVAFAGSLAFLFVAQKTNTKNAILISLFIWAGVVIYIYAFVHSITGFWIVAMIIAIVLGGSQALSRSFYSRLIPKDKEAEYFGLYEISERGASLLGPFVFGLALQFTHSYRFAILSLIIFFILGIILMFFVNTQKGMEMVEQDNTPINSRI